MGEEAAQAAGARGVFAAALDETLDTPEQEIRPSSDKVATLDPSNAVTAKPEARRSSKRSQFLNHADDFSKLTAALQK